MGRQSSIYAERPEIGGNQMPSEPCRGNPGRRFAVIEVTIPLPGGISGPMRGAEPLDAPTLLIDENGRLPADCAREMIQ